MTAYTSEESLPWKQISDGLRMAVVKLGPGDRAPNFASTKDDFVGPCTVTYRQYLPDMGIRQNVEDLTEHDRETLAKQSEELNRFVEQFFG
jgi:hypothetical protein